MGDVELVDDGMKRSFDKSDLLIITAHIKLAQNTTNILGYVSEIKK
jgi:hypothetical protein